VNKVEYISSLRYYDITFEPEIAFIRRHLCQGRSYGGYIGIYTPQISLP